MDAGLSSLPSGLTETLVLLSEASKGERLELTEDQFWGMELRFPGGKGIEQKVFTCISCDRASSLQCSPKDRVPLASLLPKDRVPPVSGDYV